MDQQAHAGYKEQPDGRKRIEQESGVGIERSEPPVALNEVQMPIAAAQPRVNNLLERMSRAMREVRVLDDREAGEKERKDDHAHADRVNRGLLQPPAEKEHHRGPEGREERNQPDVVEKEHVVSRRSLVVRYSSFAVGTSLEARSS